MKACLPCWLRSLFKWRPDELAQCANPECRGFWSDGEWRNKTLSEWFVDYDHRTDRWVMRCYVCKMLSSWRTHEEYRRALKAGD